MTSQGRLNERTTQSLEYIQSMLGQLRNMAQAEQAEMIAYLIEMAYTETSDVLRGHRPLQMDRSRSDMGKRDSAA